MRLLSNMIKSCDEYGITFFDLSELLKVPIEVIEKWSYGKNAINKKEQDKICKKIKEYKINVSYKLLLEYSEKHLKELDKHELFAYETIKRRVRERYNT